jgi:hypothetical protein
MTLRQGIVALATLALAACSPGPAPVATSPNDPSNPRAPEGASPLAPANQPAEAPGGAHDHGHMHGAPNAAGAGSAAPSPGQAVVYTCPMHPEVTSPSPGQCPKCGMNLVPKK